VQPVPPTGAKYQVTNETSSAAFPVWSPDGKQLIFATLQVGLGRLNAVDIQTQPTFLAGKAKPLPIDNITLGIGQRNFDSSPDGKQFFVMLPTEVQNAGQSVQQINVVLNWFHDLIQRVPVK